MPLIITGEYVTSIYEVYAARMMRHEYNIHIQSKNWHLQQALKKKLTKRNHN